MYTHRYTQTTRSLTRSAPSFFGLLCIFMLLATTTLAQGGEIPTQEEFDKLSQSEREKILSQLPPGPSLGAPIDANTPGAVNCFDYYTFGSVQVDVSPVLEQTIPGIALPFLGTITNENPYPVVDGQVWVKIFKINNTNESNTKMNGYPLVDFFLAGDNIAIDAGAKQELQFTWDVPVSFEGGEYSAAFFFTTAHRYNLLGLSFTDDVVGNKATFTITPGEDTVRPAYWNKHNVYLNDTQFRFAAPPPHFEMNEPVVLTSDLVNPTNDTKIIEVTWVTSKWDAILDTHVVRKDTQGYRLEPKETKKITYTPPIIPSSVIFIETIATDGDASSVMHVRFVRDGVSETRINFPSILSYPITAGEENTLFSCVHSTNLPVVNDNTLTLTLKDKDNNVIHTYAYEGDITGAMMGLKDSFTPSENYATFSLTATLMQGSTLVDEVTIDYNCGDIDESTCSLNDRATKGLASDATVPIQTTIYIVILSLVIIGALYLLIYYRKKKEAGDVTTPEPYDTNV